MGSATTTTGIVATGAGPGVMPAQVLGGPIWWYFFAVYLLSIALALYVFVDSMRPARKARFAELREPAWLYTACMGFYVASVVVVWVPGIPRVASVLPVALALPALAAGVAYLLRVVFPKNAAATSADAPSDGVGPEPPSTPS